MLAFFSINVDQPTTDNRDNQKALRYIDNNDFILSFHIDKVCQTYMNTEFGDKIFTLACAPEFVSSNLHQIGNRIKYLLFFKCFLTNMTS